ncbi:MAG: hypothetical protein N2235_26305, partial [Fischerella sp.]|nr:hypothetical protein [Fischerella sp.]
GNAGNITIKAPTGTVSFDGKSSTAFSNVEAGAEGRGGVINITARSLSLTNGGQLNTFVRKADDTKPAGIGDAGNVKLNITDGINIANISDSDILTGIFSDVESGARGNAGNIDIDIIKGSLFLINGAELDTSNQGQGNAGNIKITTAKDIRLNNDASITANTKGGQGNISLNSRNLILRRNSNITTNATGTATGGNITINTDNIVAFPNENSDITANAFSGSGGKITINTQALFGMVVRSRAELERLLNTTEPAQLDPNKLPTNDITAISQQNPTLSGTVTINTPDINPSQGLTEL